MNERRAERVNERTYWLVVRAIWREEIRCFSQPHYLARHVLFATWMEAIYRLAARAAPASARVDSIATDRLRPNAHSEICGSSAC
jgi:hypothetical protein